jgi:predicted amidohydrolase
VQPLTLSLIQTATRWHDPAANRLLFEAWLAQVPADTDLVVLPEMFSTGFTMASAEVAEDTAGPTLTWLGEQARLHDKTLCGSLVVAEEGGYFNRFVWMPPGGSRVFYDKRHRFRMAGEHLHYAAGSRRVIVECNGWRILPLVCYDLRFPVWLRNRRQGDAQNYEPEYDLLLCVANWPAARRLAWQTLLRARAIENLCYAAGVNVVGTDGNGVDYSGDSGVYGPEGQQLLDAASGAGVFTATLDGEALNAYRGGFPAWQDADEFELKE